MRLYRLLACLLAFLCSWQASAGWRDLIQTQLTVDALIVPLALEKAQIEKLLPKNFWVESIPKMPKDRYLLWLEVRHVHGVKLATPIPLPVSKPFHEMKLTIPRVKYSSGGQVHEANFSIEMGVDEQLAFIGAAHTGQGPKWIDFFEDSRLSSSSLLIVEKNSDATVAELYWKAISIAGKEDNTKLALNFEELAEFVFGCPFVMWKDAETRDPRSFVLAEYRYDLKETGTNIEPIEVSVIGGADFCKNLLTNVRLDVKGLHSTRFGGVSLTHTARMRGAPRRLRIP